MFQSAGAIIIMTAINAMPDHRALLDPAMLDTPGMDSLLTTVWAVLPVLTYPFLPSTGIVSMPCPVFLLWPIYTRSYLHLRHLGVGMQLRTTRTSALPVAALEGRCDVVIHASRRRKAPPTEARGTKTRGLPNQRVRGLGALFLLCYLGTAPRRLLPSRQRCRLGT